MSGSLKGSLLPVTNKYGLIESTATALMLTLALPRGVRSCRWSAATDAQIICQFNCEVKIKTIALQTSVCYYCTQLATTLLCFQQKTCTKSPKLILCWMIRLTKHISSAHSWNAVCAGWLSGVIMTHSAIITPRDKHDCRKPRGEPQQQHEAYSVLVVVQAYMDPKEPGLSHGRDGRCTA